MIDQRPSRKLKVILQVNRLKWRLKTMREDRLWQVAIETDALNGVLAPHAAEAVEEFMNGGTEEV